MSTMTPATFTVHGRPIAVGDKTWHRYYGWCLLTHETRVGTELRPWRVAGLGTDKSSLYDGATRTFRPLLDLDNGRPSDQGGVSLAWVDVQADELRTPLDLFEVVWKTELGLCGCGGGEALAIAALLAADSLEDAMLGLYGIDALWDDSKEALLARTFLHLLEGKDLLEHGSSIAGAWTAQLGLLMVAQYRAALEAQQLFEADHRDA